MTHGLFTAAFWKATAERAIRTFAQSLAAVLVAGATNLFDVDWPAALATAGLATLLAVLTAIGAANVGAKGPGLTETPTAKAGVTPAARTAPAARPPS
jgi:hypothetical protein